MCCHHFWRIKLLPLSCFVFRLLWYRWYRYLFCPFFFVLFPLLSLGSTRTSCESCWSWLFAAFHCCFTEALKWSHCEKNETCQNSKIKPQYHSSLAMTFTALPILFLLSLGETEKLDKLGSHIAPFHIFAPEEGTYVRTILWAYFPFLIFSLS